jgi:arabinan endo-1,5-alpha-L-arabinosidase
MPSSTTRVEAGPFLLIYDPSVGEEAPWYINDHCFIRGADGLFHLFGITHAEPLSPMDEKLFAHATAPRLTDGWTKQPPALEADLERWGETQLWAPHVVPHAGLYWMFYCAGGGDHQRYRIHLATSADLASWTRHPANPVVVDGFDARDPNVLADGGRWIMYHTATLDPAGGQHIVACRTSDDLVTWGERQVAFVDTAEAGTFGGSTESPFVVRRGRSYYLFLCNNDRRNGYRSTDVFASRDPLSFRLENKVGTVAAHAAEVVRDVDGSWYVSHCGWGQGGVYLAPLTWHDDEDENDTSLPVPGAAS